MVWLIDMDGVLADFEEGFLDMWREQHPSRPYVSLENRTTYRLEEQYPKDCYNLIFDIFKQKGLFSSLRPVKGGIEAIKEMREMGLEPFICTAPFPESKYCIPEKYEWVEKHLGSDWIRRTIPIADKTLIIGEILIDDKPEISGIEKPVWEHVHYEMLYNKDIPGKRKVTWNNWKQVLGVNNR